MHKFITVRMEEGEAPVVKVYGRGSYYHREQGVEVATGASVEVEAPPELRDLLDALIEAAGEDVDSAVRDAEVTDAAAALRQSRAARKRARQA